MEFFSETEVWSFFGGGVRVRLLFLKFSDFLK